MILKFYRKQKNQPGICWRLRRLAGGRTAGRYAQGWKGDYGFICPVGNAQLSCVYQRLFQTTGDAAFKDAASDFLKEILGTQVLDPASKAFGALPGSAPFWGPYMRFKYPNWAVKFFLDALAYQSPLPGRRSSTNSPCFAGNGCLAE